MLFQVLRSYRSIRFASSFLPFCRARSSGTKSKHVPNLCRVGLIDSAAPFRRFSGTVSTEDGISVILPHTPSASSKNRSNDQESAAKEENRDVTTLLNMVIEKLRDRGTELVLADSFLENLEKSPLALLLKEGPTLKMNYIADAFSLRPKFLEISTSRWEAILKTFRDADISVGIVLAAVVGNPKIFELDPRELNRTLVELSSLGIQDRAMAAVLAKRPQVLTSDIERIHDLIEKMNSFFPRGKLAVLIRRDPDVLFMDFEKLEAKYEYVYFAMGLEPIDLYRSRKWHRLSLASIECRHHFLVRCGVYVMPDEKKVAVAVDNPRLELILDSDDEDFCRLANVSLLEWETFKKIYEEEEPYEPEQLTVGYLRRTGRMAPREQEDNDEEWEDVTMEEVVEDERRDEQRQRKGKRDQRSGLEKRSKKKRGKGSRLDDQKGDAEEDMDKPSSNKRSLNPDSSRPHIDDSDEKKFQDKEKELEAKRQVYARPLTNKEMAELHARVNKMRVSSASGSEDANEEEESETDDDEYQEYERRRMEKREQKSKMTIKDRVQFRKRGVFLASED